MENVILFGAGASLRSGGIIPKAPPRGSDLFEELRREYPVEWNSLPPDVEAKFVESGDFEQGMYELLFSEDQDRFTACMQCTSRYFAAFKPDCSGTNLYTSLISQLGERHLLERTLLSTLNYECILEHACHQVGVGVNYSLDLHRIGLTANVWKLHGSCNFRPPTPLRMNYFAGNRIIGGNLSQFAATNAPPEAINPAEVEEFLRGHSWLFTVMCMYAPGKDCPFTPDTIKAYQQRWDALVRSAKLVVVIGVNFQPADQHVWGAVIETQAPVLWIGSEKAFNSFHSARTDRETHFICREFGSAIDSLSQILADSTHGHGKWWRRPLSVQKVHVAISERANGMSTREPLGIRSEWR
jgi:hypothetical protein